ncbi:polysaccharide pyruvyl transferase family protein [Bacteroides sp.]|uniref:polysaccharide pyruvyl transferase family protein n=1 Tax=Bacteroides sp. TaxID=29523 RepID=UPI00261359B2|nr:polysaccharide pyruvyl transferase family protein [Bacteroides sp.]MDD3037278.1 polysaccharide pyruvyl transferase family protein [Bacteroides sp.]
MVTITVIGWYGTETIGDRAILAGLIRIFGELYDDFEIKLGSLFPVLSERTLLEDGHFFKSCSRQHLSSMSVFPSLNHRILKKEIYSSDLLIVGGGPLMDMPLLYMLEYAFQIAQKYCVKCALLGCGWGPLHQKEYISCVNKIIQMSDLNIFRDSQSEKECRLYLSKEDSKTTYLIDPAFLAADYYLQKNIDVLRQEAFVSVNFRDIALDQYKGDSLVYEKQFKLLLSELVEKTSVPIKLIPMHTFTIGGDDRIILDKIQKQMGNEQILVQHDPLSLEETMNIYYHSLLCVGMRFHSIVLQTVLNGKNYLLDYTDPVTGKIVGMLDELQLLPFYHKRYCSLQSREQMFHIDSNIQRFTFNERTFSNYLRCYKEKIRLISI